MIRNKPARLDMPAIRMQFSGAFIGILIKKKSEKHKRIFIFIDSGIRLRRTGLSVSSQRPGQQRGKYFR